ncbi:MAG: hypothetical protein HQL17_00005, partial [Candidatus Omnitrophica bacterium]|nr:hypothetical protein [Candidatus Omnitrophota bacterium]
LPLEAKVADVLQGLKRAQSDAQEKANALAKLNDQYHALQNELGGVSQSKASIEKELLSAQESLKALNASIPSKISDARKPLEDKLAQLGFQSENLTVQLKDRSSALAEALKARDALGVQAGALKEQAAKLTVNLVQTQAALKEVQDKMPDQLASVRLPLEAKVAELMEGLKKSQADAQEKANALAVLNDQHQALQIQLSNLEQGKVLLEENLASEQQVLKTLNASLPGKMMAARQPLEAAITKLNAQAQDLQDQLKGRSAVIAEVSGERDALKAKLSLAQESLKELNSAIPLKMVEARKPLEDKLAQLSSQTENLNAQLKDRSSVIAQITKERDLLNAQLKAAQEQSTKLTASLAEAQAALKGVQDKMPDQLASVRLPLEAKVAEVQQG